MPPRTVRNRRNRSPHVPEDPHPTGLPQRSSLEPAAVDTADDQALLHPTRSRRLPLRFRGGSSGPGDMPPQAQLATSAPVEEAEENFDLAGVSSGEEPSVPRARGHHYTDDLQSTAATDPLMTTQSSQKQAASSADVAFFFTKRKGEPSSCVVCQ